MDRLTYWNCKDKNSALPVAINDMGDTVSIEDICVKLAAYEDAEEQGLLVVLPCKTGRTIYVIDSKKINHCITENVLVRNGLLARNIGTDTHYAVYPENIGKTVFLTRQEAEKALEGMEDGN